MKIKIGKYILCSDSLCMWIAEEYATKKGGVRSKRVAGYSNTIETLLQSFARNKLLNSDAESIEVLLLHLRQIMTDIEEINRVAFEKDFRLAERKK